MQESSLSERIEQLTEELTNKKMTVEQLMKEKDDYKLNEQDYNRRWKTITDEKNEYHQRLLGYVKLKEEKELEIRSLQNDLQNERSLKKVGFLLQKKKMKFI